MTVVIVYDICRSVHLRRFSLVQPDHVLLFRQRSYDFYEKEMTGVNAKQLSFFGILASLAKINATIYELNEPMYVRNLLRIYAYILVIRLRAFLAGQPASIVTFAIENSDVDFALAHRFRFLPSKLVQSCIGTLIRLAGRRFDRIFFGSTGAFELYKRMGIVGPNGVTNIAVKDALAQPCLACTPDKVAGKLVFVGSLERRKGLLALRDAWHHVVSKFPNASLLVMGTGPEENAIREWERECSSVKFIAAPNREMIHSELSSAKALILFSQREGIWREQIGLPILEGLSHGCEIVTSSDTGIAAWLEANQHQVLRYTASTNQLASAILEALNSVRSPVDILRSLPVSDVRLDATYWMWGRHDHS